MLLGATYRWMRQNLANVMLHFTCSIFKVQFMVDI